MADKDDDKSHYLPWGQASPQSNFHVNRSKTQQQLENQRRSWGQAAVGVRIAGEGGDWVELDNGKSQRRGHVSRKEKRGVGTGKAKFRGRRKGRRRTASPPETRVGTGAAKFRGRRKEEG